MTIEITLEELNERIAALEARFPQFNEAWSRPGACDCCRCDYETWTPDAIHAWDTYDSLRWLRADKR